MPASLATCRQSYATKVLTSGTRLVERIRSVARIIRLTAKALARAHAAGVVHRDLKPENLFVVVHDDEEPAIKILDFGIAKFAANAAARSTIPAGTPLYMAPEQTKRSATIGPSTDIWALGLIAYIALVGQPFWEAGDVHSLYGEILDGNYEQATVRALRHGVRLPPAFDAFFARCVAKDPQQRFATASEAASALESAIIQDVRTEANVPATSPNSPIVATLPWQPGQERPDSVEAPAKKRLAAPQGHHARVEEAPTGVPSVRSGRETAESDTATMTKYVVAIVAIAVGAAMFGERLGCSWDGRTPSSEPARPAQSTTATAPTAEAPKVETIASEWVSVTSNPPGARVTESGIAVGAALGDAHLADVVAVVRRSDAALDPTRTGELVILDFEGVEAINSSYVRSAVRSLYAIGAASTGIRDALGLEPADISHSADQNVRLNVFPALAHLDANLKQELLFYQRGDPQFCYVEAIAERGSELARAVVYGLEDKALRETLALVTKHRRVTAPQLFEAQRRPAIQATAWNNRLTDLCVRRLVRRERDGRAWVYSPIATEVTIHG